MEIIEDIKQLSDSAKGCVLSIGNFDGVHIGHRKILHTAKDIARQRNSIFTVMTFEPHPVAILYPEKAPGTLTTLNVKKKLLAECGVDKLLVVKDSMAVLKLTPPDFVRQFLARYIEPSVVVEGDDFNFGSDRKGNVNTLRTLGRSSGFSVEVVPQQEIEISTGQYVRASSTIIRYMLEGAHISDANLVLGRNYELFGEVITGRGKGKQLGFPTLNMQKPPQIIPAEGVYAGFVRLADTKDGLIQQSRSYPAVFSIGQARTYGENHPLLIESHLLEKFDNENDKKFMIMEFMEFIRTQHKFKSEKQLSEQIKKDCRKAKEILGSK